MVDSIKRSAEIEQHQGTDITSVDRPHNFVVITIAYNVYCYAAPVGGNYASLTITVSHL